MQSLCDGLALLDWNIEQRYAERGIRFLLGAIDAKAHELKSNLQLLDAQPWRQPDDQEKIRPDNSNSEQDRNR